MSAIREARADDAPLLAKLCGELGYPATVDAVIARLAAIDAHCHAALFVAQDPSGAVVAWAQVALQAHLWEEMCAEVLGLVVDARVRSGGIGRALLAHCEAWAKDRGAAALRVRSAEHRGRAHGFYERAGYARVKRQWMFGKTLA